MTVIGQSFYAELAAAGLGTLPIMWKDDGTFDIAQLTTPQQAIFMQVLAKHDPTKMVPVPPRLLAKLTIVDRLIAAKLIDQALAAMASNAILKARWDAAAAIDTTDPAVLQFLQAIGADPVAILAP